MSEEGVITKRDVGQLVKDTLEEDLEPGNGVAERVAMLNLCWTFWEQLGSKETDPSITADEADELIEQLPADMDDLLQD